MIEGLTREVSPSRKQLLSVVGHTAVAVTFLVAQGAAISSMAQSQPEAQLPKPAFEVASIRPDDPGSPFKLVRMMFEPDGYSATHTTLRLLIKDAYGVGDKQILGAPTWTNSVRYGIEARIDSTTARDLGRLSEDERRLAHQLMLQALLADRFKLTLHKEIRELPVYSLVIAKNGSKLRVSKPGDTYEAGLKTASGNIVGPHMMLMQLGGGQIGGQGVLLEVLVKQLSSQLGRVVQDKTGLTGSYDFNLRWAPDSARTPAGGEQQGSDAATSEFYGPSLFTALEEQLGLKLESQKGPVEILVVDHVEMPTEN